MVLVPNICTVKTNGKTSFKYKSTNMEWTDTASESGLIRPKQNKNKKYFYWIFLKKLGIILANKTPAKSKQSNYGP